MFSWNVRKILGVTIAVAAICCLAAPRRLAAASPDASANITFTASGTFSQIQLSGADVLQLRGQPFIISVVGNSAAVPTQHGRNWAVFTNLPVSGSVSSAITGPVPIPSGTLGAIDQTVGASEDIVQAGFQLVLPPIYGVPPLTVKAHFVLPGGTLTKALLRPFASVTLGPNTGSCGTQPPAPDCTYVSYANPISNPPAETVLQIASGTLVATLPTGGAEKTASAGPAFVLLAGAQAVKPRWIPTV